VEIEGWIEIPQKTWVTLPLQIRATVTFSDPYKVVFIADAAGLEKLKQQNAERTTTTDAEEGVEGDSSGAEDSEAQHGSGPGTDQSTA